MSMHGRRRFVAGMGAAFAVGTMSLAVRAAMGPDDKFDLVIKGGELLDPGQKLRVRRDIGIRVGRIEAIEADIPVTRASRRSEEHTSELQSPCNLVCRLLLEKKKKK